MLIKKSMKILSMLLALSIVLALVPTPLFVAASATENSDIARYAALILDTSGSMKGTPASIQKQAAIKFCTTLLNTKGSKNYIAIVRLNTTSSVGLGFTDNLDELKTYINGIPADGGTNIEEALDVAGKLMDDIDDSSNSVIKNIVLCSDGIPESGKTSSSGPYTSSDSKYYQYANAAYNTAEALKSKCNLYSLGFFHSLGGDELQFGQKLMEGIQNAGNYVVTNPDELEFTFGEIADDITQSVLKRKFIEEHVEYAKSQEYEDYIVRGFGPHMTAVLDDVTGDVGIKAYKFLDSFSSMLSLDLDFDETSEYELLLAQVLFNSAGGDRDSFTKAAIESNFTKYFSDALLSFADIIVGSNDFVAIVGQDSRDRAKDLLRTMAFQDPTSSAYSGNAVRLFDYLNGYDNLDLKAMFSGKELSGALRGTGLDFLLGMAVDELQAVCNSADKLLIYLAAGKAYADTSDAFAGIILNMRQQIAYGNAQTTDRIFLPITDTNLVTEQRLYHAMEIKGGFYPYPNATDVDPTRPIHIGELARALENFYNGINNYKQGNIQEIANACVQDYLDNQPQIWVKNGASAVLQLGQCLPVIREYQALKVLITAGKFFVDVATGLDDREYAGTCVMRLFCLSYILHPIIDNMADAQRRYDIKTDPRIPIPGSQMPSLEEYQFSRAVAFDEAINIYRSIRTVASDYGMEYEHELLKAENSKLFPSAKKVSWYSTAVTLAATEKLICQHDIRCHSDELNYDPNTGEVTFNGNLKVCTFACPVDITVLSDTGTQVAYLSNSGSEIVKGYEKYFFTVESANAPGDFIKIAVVPESYRVMIAGIETGSMNAYVANYDEDEIQEAEIFHNVPITADTEGYLVRNASDDNLDRLVLNGETIEPKYAVIVTGGTADKTEYAEGDTVTITATVPQNKDFFKWNSDDDIAFANEAEISTTFVMPAKDVNVTAIFNDISGYIIWLNGDGSELDRKPYQINEAEPITDKTPTKAEDANYTYTFSGWNAGTISGTNKVYTPVFISHEKSVLTSSGNSSSSNGVAIYAIKTSSGIGGSVKADVQSAKGGKTVTLQVVANINYELRSLSVEDSHGNNISVENKGDGKYVFTMPYSKVTVTADFRSTKQEPLKTESPKFVIAFTDVSEGAFYYEAVLWAAETGITKGKSSTLFEPYGICTRAQTVTFLWRAAGSPEPVSNDTPFSDINENAYFYKAVLWAVEQGITKGTTTTTFSPDNTVSRAQVVTFLYRSANSPYVVSDDNPFTDVPQNSYYHSAVTWASKTGVTQGRTSTTFNPSEDCNRGQIVTFLYRHFVK